ncbi:MAG: hypothetical protein NXI31_15815 [bacterium]|nr:hypothetical protein [bacterium]
MKTRSICYSVAAVMAICSSACQGVPRAAPQPLPSPNFANSGPTNDVTAASRASTREIELLRALLVTDQKAVELARQNEQYSQSLFDSGRLSHQELMRAQLETLKLEQQLLIHQRDLAVALADAERKSPE